MKKKILAITLICIMMLSFSVSAAVIDFTVGSTTSNSYDGETLTTKELESAPFVNESDRTMVPVRVISETFGAAVGWDDPTQTVTVTSGETVLKLVIGSNTADLNGEQVTMDSAPVLVNGRTFVPLRFIGESLGFNINYCSVTEQIIIDNTPVVAVCGNQSITFAEFEAVYDVVYNLNHDALANQNYSEEEIKMYIANFTLEEICNYPYVYNAFPDVSLNDEYKKTILETAGKEAELFNTPLTSLITLVEEKAVFSTLQPVIYSYSDRASVAEEAKEFVQAKHILVEDEKLANEIYEKAVAGEDFDALVEAHNTDPGMKQNPKGYIFTKGQMVEPFEKAAFALGYGEISKPVKTDFGYHIIKRSDDDRDIRIELALAEVTTVITNAETPVTLMTVEDLCALL